MRKIIILIFVSIILSGCETVPAYPQDRPAALMADGADVACLALFPKEVCFMARKGGLFDLSQTPYEGMDWSLRKLIENEFKNVYFRMYKGGFHDGSHILEEDIEVLRVRAREGFNEQFVTMLRSVYKYTSVRYVFLLTPTEGYEATVSVGLIPVRVDRSLRSFTLDKMTINGESMKCDAFVNLVDLESGEVVARYKYIDNWVNVNSIDFKEDWDDYTELDRKTIEDAAVKAVEAIAYKSLKRAYR